MASWTNSVITLLQHETSSLTGGRCSLRQSTADGQQRIFRPLRETVSNPLEDVTTRFQVFSMPDLFLFQPIAPGPLPPQAQDLHQVEELEPRVQRGIPLRNPPHRVVHAEPLRHRLGQGLRQEQRLPWGINPGRRGVQRTAAEALVGRDQVPRPSPRVLAQLDRGPIEGLVTEARSCFVSSPSLMCWKINIFV